MEVGTELGWVMIDECLNSTQTIEFFVGLIGASYFIAQCIYIDEDSSVQV